MHRAQSGATSPGQSGLGSDGNERLLRIPQSSSFTITSLSDGLVTYLGHTLGFLALCRDAVVFYGPSRLGKANHRVKLKEKQIPKPR